MKGYVRRSSQISMNVQYPTYLHNNFHRSTSYLNASSAVTSERMSEWFVDFGAMNKDPKATDIYNEIESIY